MKRYLFYVIILTALPLIFAACEDKIDTYSSMDRIYFSQNTSDGQPDSIYINLKEYTSEGIVYVNDSVIHVPLKILGAVSGVDRTVSVVQADVNSYSWIKRRLWGKSEAVSGTDFVIEDCIIPANKEVGYANIRLKNTDALKNRKDTIVVALYVADNENFITDYTNMSGKTDVTSINNTQDCRMYRIFFYSDLNEAPRMWYYTSTAPSSRNLVEHASVGGGIPLYLGLYTPEKFQLFLDATSLEADMFEFTDNDYGLVNTDNPTTITYTGVRKLFEARFNSMSTMFSRWNTQVNRYMTDNPDRWADFPGDSIQWGLKGAQVYNGNSFTAIGWGVWKK